jgi:hypothetical protein
MDAGGAMELESFFAHAKAKAKCARRAEDRLNSYGSRLLEHGKWRRATIPLQFSINETHRIYNRKKALRLSLRSRKHPMTGTWPVS